MGSCRAWSVYLTTLLLVRLSPLKRLTSIVHIILPETDNCPSWISGREGMTIENIPWSNLYERMLAGVEPATSWSTVGRAPNWATEAGWRSCVTIKKKQKKKKSKCPEGRFLIMKYFKVNDNDIRQDIVHNVSLWVTLIYHPKYNFPGVNSLLRHEANLLGHKI